MGVRCPCSRSNTHALNWVFGVPVENIVLNLLAGFSVVLGSALLGGLLPTLLMLLPGNKAQYYTILETVVGKVEEVETKAIVPVRDIYLEKTAQISNRAPCVEQEWIVVEEQDVHAGEWIAFTSEVTEIPEIVNPEIAAVMAMVAELDLMIAQAEKVIALANEFDAACNETQPSLSPNVIASLNEYYGAKQKTVKANTLALLLDLDTIGNPDRADAFGSYGMTDAQLEQYMNEDNLAQDWYDNQLYV